REDKRGVGPNGLGGEAILSEFERRVWPKTTALEAAGAKMIGRQDIYASMGARPLLGLLNAAGDLLAYNSPCTGRSLEGVLASQLCRKPAPASGEKTSPKTLDFPASHGTMDPESEVMRSA